MVGESVTGFLFSSVVDRITTYSSWYETAGHFIHGTALTLKNRQRYNTYYK